MWRHLPTKKKRSWAHLCKICKVFTGKKWSSSSKAPQFLDFIYEWCDIMTSSFCRHFMMISKKYDALLLSIAFLEWVYLINFPFQLYHWRINWNISKGNQVPIRNWCPQLTWKLNLAISLKIRELNQNKSKQIKTNENQWRFWSFYI